MVGGTLVDYMYFKETKTAHVLVKDNDYTDTVIVKFETMVQYKPHGEPEFIADALKPCPFCGTYPILTFIGNAHTKNRKVEIKCPSCRASMLNAGIRSSAERLARMTIINWNNRANS